MMALPRNVARWSDARLSTVKHRPQNTGLEPPGLWCTRKSSCQAHCIRFSRDCSNLDFGLCIDNELVLTCPYAEWHVTLRELLLGAHTLACYHNFYNLGDH